MNERIKQFAEQAKTSVPDGLLVNEWIEKYNEIFAELIVQECIDIVDKYGESLELLHIRAHIKEHFGVEE